MTQLKHVKPTRPMSNPDREHFRGPGVALGVAASASGRAALQVAVREAAARGVPLHLIRIWEDLSWLPSMTLDSVAMMEASERAGSLTLDEAVHLAHDLDPGVVLVPEAPAGELYELLLNRVLEADLLVLGSDHEQVLADDLANWFAEHAGCPVVAVSGSGEVVRGRAYLRSDTAEADRDTAAADLGAKA
jgi:hypothetical protein